MSEKGERDKFKTTISFSAGQLVPRVKGEPAIARQARIQKGHLSPIPVG